MKQFFAFLFIVFHGVVNSQDTLTELNLNQFLQHVKENHPVALIAQNNLALADQYVRLSKGAFDPVLMGGVDQKYFDGKTYYSTIGAGLKIPTRIGVDVKMMANWSRGVYLNNENTLPDQGLTAIGVEVPIGKGLLTDERRNQLKRAVLGTQQSLVEQQLALNDLLYEAGQAFISWQEQEAQLLLALEGLALAETRYQQIYANVALGERADIDTVEAIAQLFLRQMEVDQRRLNAQNTRLVVENYLWEKGVLPLVLDDGIKPQPLVLIAPVPRLSDTLDQHPIVTWYDLKRKDLQLERQLKLEQLKPQLNVNYNLLQTPQNAAAFNYSLSNYKWGGTLYVPIFLRKERASLQMTTIKMANVALEQEKKQREITMKHNQVQNEWLTLCNQALKAQQIANHYFTLVLSERTLFETGESSLFLINAREMNYLGAQSKYIEFIAKTQKSALSDQYVKGLLGMR